MNSSYQSTHSNFINVDDYKKCAANFAYSTAKDIKAFVGISVNLLTSINLSVCIPHNGKFFFINKHFIYKEALQDEKFGGLYREWLQDRHVQIIQGNDTEFIKDQIDLFAQDLNIDSITYEAWNFNSFFDELIMAGYKMNKASMSLDFGNRTLKMYNSIIATRQMVHDDNPVMHWMIGNLIVAKTPGGNFVPSRKYSYGEIGGIIAVLLAISQCDIKVIEQ